MKGRRKNNNPSPTIYTSGQNFQNTHIQKTFVAKPQSEYDSLEKSKKEMKQVGNTTKNYEYSKKGNIRVEGRGTKVVPVQEQEITETEALEEVNVEITETEALEEVNVEIKEAEALGEVTAEIKEAEALGEVTAEIKEAEALGEVNAEVTEAEELEEVNAEVTEAEELEEVNAEVTEAEELEEVNAEVTEAEELEEVNAEITETEIFEEIKAKIGEVDAEIRKVEVLEEEDAEIKEAGVLEEEKVLDEIEETKEREAKNVSQPEEVPVLQLHRNKPFKDMTNEEKIMFLIDRPHYIKSIRCRVKTKHDTLVGFVVKYESGYVLIELPKRGNLQRLMPREMRVKLEDILSIQMVAF
ncbi:CotO family spore coat protein [Bacillus manliponensis]|uniref:CotO family spore coat protein n=1 Tax=Bacillus manliponensis TaxID=574376 RepID=UPI003511FC32